MQFLKTLFWVLVAVVVVLFAVRNWTPVTLNLWGDIQADIKIPILLLIFFLLGFLPTWATMRPGYGPIGAAPMHWSEADVDALLAPLRTMRSRRMSPIFVAVDTSDVHRAAAIAREVSGIAGGVKLGLEFFCANGDEGVLRIAERQTPIFLDLKLHDIPNTVEKAVAALAHLQPAILTVHAAGGRAMMAAAKAAAPPGTRSLE